MEHVILVIHLLLTLALIGLILLQRSEGGGLGMGSGGGGMGSLASAQTTANVLTRSTQIVGGLFFATSLILAIMASHRGQPTSILDSIDNPPAIQSSTSPEPGLADDKGGVKKTDETPAEAPKKAPSVPIGQ